MTSVAPALHNHRWSKSTTLSGVFVRVPKTGRSQGAREISRLWSEPVRASDPLFVLAEARKSLASLALPAETMRNVEAFLMKVCTAESTVPSITPGEDEGSALLHWVAGPMSVEVEVGPKGATYFWGLDQHGHQQSAEGSRLQIESMARALISVIASQVQQANPEWRRQYLQR